MKEWVTKLGDITMGHKWGATFKQCEPFSCQDCGLALKHFPKAGSERILSNGYTGCVTQDDIRKDNTLFKQNFW